MSTKLVQLILMPGHVQKQIVKHPRSPICLIGDLGHESSSLILRPEYLLPYLRKFTFHSPPPGSLTRALKGPSDTEFNTLNGMGRTTHSC